MEPYHVDECIADVALVLEIDGEVEEIIVALEVLIDSGQQHLLCVLVGDVLNHQCSPLVIPCRAALPSEKKPSAKASKLQ